MAKPFNFNPEVATVLAQICCYKNELPQGAPTSPIISNFICRRLDDNLYELARKHYCTYTRYADDITFSSPTIINKEIVTKYSFEPTTGRIKAIPSEILSGIVSANGFKIKESKVRILRPFNRQEVTGLVVNKRINVKRKFLKNLRTIIHNAEHAELETAAKLFFSKANVTLPDKDVIENFSNIVQGKLAFVKNIRGEKDSLWAKLQNKFLRVFKGYKYDKYVTKDIANIESGLWIIKCGVEKHGTGFILKDINLLVTARHVVEDNIVHQMEILVCKLDDPFNNYHGKIVAENNEYDIAVIELDNKGIESGIKFEKSSIVAKRGDILTVCGFASMEKTVGESLKNSARIQNTEFAQTRRTGNHDRILVSHLQFGGMSGGPVFNTKNEVVGIVVTGIKVADEINKSLEFGIEHISAITKLSLPEFKPTQPIIQKV